MSKEQIATIKAALKLYSGCSIDNIEIRETVKRVNAWDIYSGRYNVWIRGEIEPITTDSMELDEAIKVASIYHREVQK